MSEHKPKRYDHIITPRTGKVTVREVTEPEHKPPTEEEIAKVLEVCEGWGNEGMWGETALFGAEIRRLRELAEEYLRHRAPWFSILPEPERYAAMARCLGHIHGREFTPKEARVWAEGGGG